MKLTTVAAVLAILVAPLIIKADDKPKDIVIIGGGIAGMTAAYNLKKKDILVLEQWPSVGGRIWDDEYEGFRYARGAEYLGEPEGVIGEIIKNYRLRPVEIQSPAICHYNPHVPGYEDTKIWNGYYGIAMMHVMEDGGDAKALDAYNTFQRYTTEFVDATYEAGELPHMFDLSHMVAKFDYVSANEWFDGQRFDFTYQDKWNSHARGLYGANMDEVSILMMISELGWEYYEVEDIEMPEDDWNDYERDQYTTETYTFTDGLSAIPAAIAADEALRDKIRTSSMVTSVFEDGKTYKVTYKDMVDGATHTVETKKVVLAVPAAVALRIAGRILPDKAKKIMSGIKYCEYLTVNMFSDKPVMVNQGEDNFTFELSTPDRFWVISFYDSLYVQKIENPNNPRNDDVFITTAYVAGRTCDDSLVRMSNEEIIKRTFRDLNEIFPGASRLVKEYKVNRFKYAYPLMSLGAYHNITELNEINMKQKGVRLVGDYMALPTIEAAMEQASFATKKFK